MIGQVKIYTQKIGEEKKLYFSDSNLVVNSGREIFTNLIQSSPTAYAIQEFKAGDGLHGGTVLIPGPPDINDLDLQSPRFPTPTTGKAIDSYTFFGTEVANPLSYDHSVVIAFSMGLAEGNGYTYTEFGLFTNTTSPNLMFSEITFLGIVKDASVEISAEWTIAMLV